MFSVLASHGLDEHEVGALQYTLFPQCTINKAYKLNASITSYCHNFQVRQLLINSHKLKHKVTGTSLLILCIFNVFSVT